VLGNREKDALPVTLAVLHSEMETEAEEDGSAEADGASEAVTEGEKLAVTLWETLLEPLRVASGEALPASEAETDAVTDGEPETEPSGLPLLLCVLLPLGETLLTSEADGRPELDSVAMGL